MNIQITIDQLKNYLGTGLLCILDYGDESYSDDLIGLYANGDLVFAQDEGDVHTFEEIKPICYRMSDLDKFIPELQFVPLENLTEIIYGLEDSGPIKFELGNDFLSIKWSDYPKSYMVDPKIIFEVYQKLFGWHFWPFGEEYFEQGLVIDKLKLQCTP